MANFTFFDLVAAIRQIRQLKFTQASSEIISIPTTIRNISRSGRRWEITTAGGIFSWSEDNVPPVVISEVGSVIRAVQHFGYLDLVSAIRDARQLRFTTSGTPTLAVPLSLHNRSRNASSFTVVTSADTVTWNDDNTGATVITEI